MEANKPLRQRIERQENKLHSPMRSYKLNSLPARARYLFLDLSRCETAAASAVPVIGLEVEKVYYLYMSTLFFLILAEFC